MLVVSQDTLGGMVMNFVNVLSKLEKLFGDLKSIKTSILLAVTKTNNSV